MPKIKKTKLNPHGLSIKQQAVIQDIIEDVKQGNGLQATKNTSKYYDAANQKSAASMACQNMNQLNYRMALLEGLRNGKIIGKNGKVEKRLKEGLDAIKEDSKGDATADMTTRLSYIKEINKIAGTYAPNTQLTKSINLNMNMTEQELDNHISTLQSEL